MSTQRIIGLAAAAGVGLVAIGLPATAGAQGSPRAAAVACTADVAFGRMTPQQRVGQLFMVGTPATGASSTTLSQITNYHVGNVILTGRSTGGKSAPAATTAALRARVNAASTHNAGLFISTDQEGGYVQVLSGSGFSTIPTALTQGSWSTASIQQNATTWAQQLRSVGVNVNLAPVADTVPSAAAAATNPPIGVYKREFGYSSAVTASASSAFTRGMRAGGVLATAKHFPGLGQVTANTDTTANVHDNHMTKTNPYLNPFTANMSAGVPFVMVSSAIYDKIDRATIAAFSTVIVRDWLKGQLRYPGIVITDDVANAKAVAAWPPAYRAKNIVQAGGDMILLSSPGPLPQMYDTLLHVYTTDSWWTTKMDASVKRILATKERAGLLTNACS